MIQNVPLASLQLKRWRTEVARLTQTAAAGIFDVQQPTYSEYETGRKTPRTVLALKMAEVTEGAVPVPSWGLYVPSDTILDDKGEPVAQETEKSPSAAE